MESNYTLLRNNEYNSLFLMQGEVVLEIGVNKKYEWAGKLELPGTAFQEDTINSLQFVRYFPIGPLHKDSSEYALHNAMLLRKNFIERGSNPNLLEEEIAALSRKAALTDERSVFPFLARFFPAEDDGRLRAVSALILTPQHGYNKVSVEGLLYDRNKSKVPGVREIAREFNTVDYPEVEVSSSPRFFRASIEDINNSKQQGKITLQREETIKQRARGSSQVPNPHRFWD